MNKNNFDIILGDFVAVNVPSYSGLQSWTTEREPHDYAHLDFYITKGGEITIKGKTYVDRKSVV